MTRTSRIRFLTLLFFFAFAFALSASDNAYAYWSASGTGASAGRTATWQAPTNVHASATSTTVTITWDAATFEGSATTSLRYDVLRSDGVLVVCNSTALSCVNSGVTGGTYTYTVTATFPTFSAKSAASNSVIIDTTAPVTSDNTASIGNSWKSTDVTVTLSASDNSSGVAKTYYTTNGTTPTTTSAQGTSVTLSNEGVYTIKYFSIDNAGNAEAVKTAATQVRIDKTAPVAAVSYPTPATYRNASWSGIFSGTATDAASGVSSVSVALLQNQTGKYWNGSAFTSATPVMMPATGTTNWTYTFPSSSFPADGSYVLTVKTTDNANNPDSSTALTFQIDNATVKPSTPDLTAGTDSGNSNTDNITNAASPTFTGTAEPRSTVVIFANGTSVGNAVADSFGNYTVTTTISTSATYAITAQATDLAGNVSVVSDALSVTIDRIAPAKPAAPDLTAATDSGSSSIDNITNSTTPTFTGTADANTTVAIYADATPLNGGAVSATTYTVATTIANDGSYAITAKATDVAGNVSLASDPLTVTIDRTAPALSSLEMYDSDSDGKVDRVLATFSETLVSPTTLATQWTLASVPSGGTRNTSSVSGKVATILVNEGSGAADTSVGSFTVALTANVNGIRDAAGNASFFAATQPTDMAAPLLVSASSGGGSTVGRMQAGDTLSLTFSEALATNTVPGSVVVKEVRSGSSTLSVVGLLNDTSIANGYLAGNNSSAQATATVTMSNANKTLTLTLGAITTTGAGGGTGSGSVTLTPDAKLEDEAGNSVTGSASVNTLF